MSEPQTEIPWHPVGENRLKLILPAAVRMQALIGLIERAEHSLHLFFYMFEDDAVGAIVRDSLIKACNRGVSVELIVDSFGSNGSSSAFFAPLQEAGAKFAIFSPRFSTSYFTRNHQKMIIVDRVGAMIGGFNIADQYFDQLGEDSEIDQNPTAWEDVGLVIEGPAVSHLHEYYDQLSQWVNTKNGNLRSLRKLVRKWDAGTGDFQWLLGGPTNRLSPWAVSIKNDLERGKRLDLASAYFSPGQGMLRRISRLSKTGGTSRIVLPGSTDNGATIGASRLLYGYLLKRNAKIFEYQPKRLHMKLVIVDDAVYIGSANFDLRSLFINVEMMLRVENQKFADHARSMVTDLTKKSERITPELHKRRSSLLNRIRWAISYFVVNILDYSVARRTNFGLAKNTSPAALPNE